MKFVDLRKSHDVVKFAVDLILAHPQNGTVQVNVLASGQFRMEACANLEQGTHPAVNFCKPFGGFDHPGEDLEQRALACAVLTDDTQVPARVPG